MSAARLEPVLDPVEVQPGWRLVVRGGPLEVDSRPTRVAEDSVVDALWRGEERGDWGWSCAIVSLPPQLMAAAAGGDVDGFVCDSVFRAGRVFVKRKPPESLTRSRVREREVVEAAHREVGGRALGRKTPDRDALPICARHHREPGLSCVPGWVAMDKPTRAAWWMHRVSVFRLVWVESRGGAS